MKALALVPAPVLAGVGVGIVALGALLVVGWQLQRVAKAKLNPASDANVIYKDVIGGVGRSLSGSEDWTLGGWVYDLTHPGVRAELERLTKGGASGSF